MTLLNTTVPNREGALALARQARLRASGGTAEFRLLADRSGRASACVRRRQELALRGRGYADIYLAARPRKRGRKPDGAEIIQPAGWTRTRFIASDRPREIVQSHREFRSFPQNLVHQFQPESRAVRRAPTFRKTCTKTSPSPHHRRQRDPFVAVHQERRPPSFVDHRRASLMRGLGGLQVCTTNPCRSFSTPPSRPHRAPGRIDRPIVSTLPNSQPHAGPPAGGVGPPEGPPPAASRSTAQPRSPPPRSRPDSQLVGRARNLRLKPSTAHDEDGSIEDGSESG